MRHLLIAALMLLPAQAAQLRITVYDRAHLPKQVSQFVFDQLRQVFHQAGIEIEVVAGDATAAEASLITVPATPRRGSEQAGHEEILPWKSSAIRRPSAKTACWG